MLLLTWEDSVGGMRLERRLKLTADGKSAEVVIGEIFPDRRDQHKVILERH